MTRKRSTNNRKSYYRKKTNNDKLIDGIVALVIIGIFFLYLIYKSFIIPNINSIRFYGLILLTLIAVILTIVLIYRIKIKIDNNKLIEEKINNIPNFLIDLDNKIKEFKPIRRHKEELLYQTELVGFLKNNYPDIKIEETREYSRPDIIIDDIAIEIKGPTNMSDLKTLPDKINSYIPKWDYLFIVLFSINIVSDKEKNMEIYIKKKQEILKNTIESKREKIFFIEI